MSSDAWKNADNDEEPIKENEGGIPKWFTILFWGCCYIALIYSIGYHAIAKWSQTKEYKEEVAEHKRMHPEVFVKLNDDGSNPYRGMTAAIASGQKHFQSVCSVCHKANATGLIGPNLVDNQWLHGNTDAKIFKTIMEGIQYEETKQRPSKGPMPSHKNSLGSKKTLEVMAWLASKNKNMKGTK